MRKVTIIALLAIMLFVNGCGATVTVSKKRFGRAPMDVRIFVTPNDVSTYGSPDVAWNTLEDGYVYLSDQWYLSNTNYEVIPGGNDFWLLPSETQYLIDRYPDSHGMDCEDGAAWLTSVFKKQGLDAWFCVGTVIVDGVIYGHAWTMVKNGNKWTTYETTVNRIVDGLPDDLYMLAWRTNGSTTWLNLASTGVELTINQLPIDKLGRFREELANVSKK